MRVRRESYLFRALVLATLVIIAGIFAFNQNKGAAPEQYDQGTCAKARELSAPKTFRAKLLDDPTAFFTAALAALTFVLAAIGVAQIFFLVRTDATARKSAEAAKQSADVARDTLTASQRAWISAQCKVGSDLLITESACYLDILVSLQNIGNLPATNINIFAWLIGDDVFEGVLDRSRTARGKHMNLCATSRGHDHTALSGFTVFPGEKYPPENVAIANSAVMPKDEMAGVVFPNVQTGEQCIQFYAGVAINYKFATDGSFHQTSFLFEVGIDGIMAAFPISKAVHNGKDIMLLELFPNYGRRAD